MWNQAVITDAGRAVFASAAAGNPLILDSAASGSRTVAADALKGCTDVSSRKQTLTVSKAESTGAEITVEVMLTAAETAYQARQIGVFGHTGSGSPCLLAIYQDEAGISVPSGSEMADFAYLFYATIQIGNAESLQVSVDPSALVTQSQLADAIRGVVQQLSVQEVTVKLDKHEWSEKTQTVSVSGMTADTKASACPTAASWLAALEANLFPPTAGEGTLSFRCEETPAEDIYVIVHMYG